MGRYTSPAFWLRRLATILLGTAAILSLLLCAACLALRHRPPRTLDRFFATDARQALWCVDVHDRTVAITRTDRWPNPELFWWLSADADSRMLPVGPTVQDPPPPPSILE